MLGSEAGVGDFELSPSTLIGNVYDEIINKVTYEASMVGEV